jgi:peptidoglycan/LPS O-acetylase OafA/YrhL
MRTIYSIQAARGLAALLVVAYHCVSIQEKYLPGMKLLPEIFRIGQTGIDLFFAISGFVMVVATKSQPYKWSETLMFLKGRLLRIYPTYWFYFAALAVVYFTVPGVINASQEGGVDLVRSFFLAPSETWPLLVVSWTLTHEIWFYIVFSGLLFLPGTARVLGLCAWFCFVLLTHGSEIGNATPALKIVTHVFSVEFILGALVGYLYIKYRDSEMRGAFCLASLAASGVLTGIWLWIDLRDVLEGSLLISMGRVVLLGGGYATALLAVALAESRGWLSVKKPFKLLGDISYSLYLSHLLVLSVCGRVWYQIHKDNPVSAVEGVGFWMVTIFAVIGGGYLAYRFVETPIMKVARGKKTQTAKPLVLS